MYFNLPASKWIFFVLVKDTGKTQVFHVIARADGATLGKISWWPAWRKYAFHPAPNTIYETDCLNHIVRFIDAMMQARKKKPSDTLLMRPSEVLATEIRVGHPEFEKFAQQEPAGDPYQVTFNIPNKIEVDKLATYDTGQD